KDMDNFRNLECMPINQSNSNIQPGLKTADYQYGRQFQVSGDLSYKDFSKRDLSCLCFSAGVIFSIFKSSSSGLWAIAKKFTSKFEIITIRCITV
ncbi:MAG: hypothetical protein AAGH40_04945, partial [Verrucomicrobiota bacterium]